MKEFDNLVQLLIRKFVTDASILELSQEWILALTCTSHEGGKNAYCGNVTAGGLAERLIARQRRRRRYVSKTWRTRDSEFSTVTSLRPGRFGFRIAEEGDFSGPRSPVYKGYRVAFPGEKWPRHEVDHCLPSQDYVQYQAWVFGTTCLNRQILLFRDYLSHLLQGVQVLPLFFVHFKLRF